MNEITSNDLLMLWHKQMMVRLFHVDRELCKYHMQCFYRCIGLVENDGHE